MPYEHKQYVPTFSQSMTLKDFMRWYSESRPGEGVVYHVGDLAYERQLTGPDRELTQKAASLSRFASEVYKLAMQAELHLIQRRIEPCLFEYMAVRTSPRSTRFMRKLLRKPLSAHEMHHGPRHHEDDPFEMF